MSWLLSPRQTVDFLSLHFQLKATSNPTSLRVQCSNFQPKLQISWYLVLCLCFSSLKTKISFFTKPIPSKVTCWLSVEAYTIILSISSCTSIVAEKNHSIILSFPWDRECHLPVPTVPENLHCTAPLQLILDLTNYSKNSRDCFHSPSCNFSKYSSHWTQFSCPALMRIHSPKKG